MTLPVLLPGTKNLSAPYTVVANSSGDVAAASAVATLPAAAGQTTYIQGFDVTGTGATSGVGIVIAVTGLPASIGTLSFDFAVIAGATLNNSLSIRFPEPIPASAVNTAIVVTAPSFGTGNLHACVTAYGFQAPSYPPGQP